MGKAIAVNLLRARHGVTVSNRSAEVAEELAGEGAKVACSAAEAAGFETVSQCLPIACVFAWTTALGSFRGYRQR